MERASKIHQYEAHSKGVRCHCKGHREGSFRAVPAAIPLAQRAHFAQMTLVCGKRRQDMPKPGVSEYQDGHAYEALYWFIVQGCRLREAEEP